MAQVSTRPTMGADEFARIAGNAIAIMVRCGFLVFVVAAGITRESCIFADIIITVLCDICVIFCNDDGACTVNDLELLKFSQTE